MKQPSKKYTLISDAYKYYASDFNADFSEEARIAFYNFETFGQPTIKYNQQYNGQYNGYAVGKHWLDVNLAMYREDIAIGNLTKHEIYNSDVPELVKEIVKEKMSR